MSCGVELIHSTTAVGPQPSSCPYLNLRLPAPHSPHTPCYLPLPSEDREKGSGFPLQHLKTSTVQEQEPFMDTRAPSTGTRVCAGRRWRMCAPYPCMHLESTKSCRDLGSWYLLSPLKSPRAYLSIPYQTVEGPRPSCRFQASRLQGRCGDLPCRCVGHTGRERPLPHTQLPMRKEA